MADEVTQKKLKEAFRLFEREGCIEVDDLGIIMRHLNLNPTEKQITALKTEMGPNVIDYNVFEAVMSKIVLTSTYDGATLTLDTEDQLLRAFEILDPERNGLIPSEKLVQLLKSQGEPMTEEEINEFLQFAQSKDSAIIRYEEYVNLLCSHLKK